MTPKEQEIAINELEERVDRLRNIYEQYFLGFEKLEPTVPRKDVDRRFALLRKEQIRNTAMRFRFQVVTQKFNTYAMHWVRICRQIEEGTYKRHVRKAQARFGDTRSADRERDISIDIELGDFEDLDVEDVLAEAEAAAASYERGAPDTMPPPASTRQMAVMTPGTSFAVAGRRELHDEVEPNTPPPSMRPFPERTRHGAALPPGAKPRVLRRRDDADAPPPSGQTMPGAPPPSHRMPVAAPAQPSSQRTFAAAPAASSPRIPGAPTTNPGVPMARPAGPRIVRREGMPESAPGMPVAAPRMPAPSAGRLPLPAPAPSAGRIPVQAPSRPNPSRPGGPNAAAPGAPSQGAIKAGPPPLGKAPPGRPGPPAPPRPPMPSSPDKDVPSGESGGPRSRVPLPLPSHLGRPTKKE